MARRKARRLLMDREADVLQQRNARIGHLGAMDDDAIHRAARFQLPVDAGFLVIRHDGQNHLVAGARVALAGTCDEIGEDGVHHLVPGGDGDDVADGHGAARGKALGAGIGLIVMLLCGRQHPLTRGLIDLRIPVEGAAYRGGRKPQLLGKLLQIHRGTSRISPGLIAQTALKFV